MKCNKDYHDDILSLCKTNTIPEIAKILNLQQNSLRGYILRNKIPYLVKKGYANETRFLTLENEADAYFYGFLVTDGHLNKAEGRSHVTLSLSHEDTHILEELKNWIETYSEIGTYVEHRSSGHVSTMKRLTFANNKVRANLEAHGLRPQKSKIATVPNNYSHSNSWSKHFWRGVIDGDGSLFINSANCRVINLVGSFDLCKNFKEYCTQSLCFDKNPVITKVQNIYSVSFSGRDAVEIAKHLYQDSDPRYRLIRKYNMMQRMVESESERNKTREGLPFDVKGIETHELKSGKFSYRTAYYIGSKKIYLGAFRTLEEAIDRQTEFKDLYLELLTN